MFITVLIIVSIVLPSLQQQNSLNLKAVAVLTSGTGQANGIIHFTQIENPDNSIHIIVCGNITGLNMGNHGFHVHQYGDLSNGCSSAGPHFNPNQLTHGAPFDSIRHIGDLGNISADINGEAIVSIIDHELRLSGSDSIIGRAVVVHASEDDLGKGTGDKAIESKKTGNAGARIACGVIGIAANEMKSSTKQELASTTEPNNLGMILPAP